MDAGNDWRGARNKGIAASLLRAHMPLRIADTNLRNSKKQPAAKVGHGMAHHEKSHDFSRWAIRIYDSES